MPLNEKSDIEVTALAWVPPPAHGLVKDLRVRWALEEAGLEYRVRLLGMERPSEYLNEQPFDQVPSFREGALQIFESGAILQYIGEKSEVLLPRDDQGKYRAIQWAYAAVSSVEPAVQLRGLLERVYAGEPWAAPSKPTFDQAARQRLRRLSDRLGQKQWLEGDRFTIGDIMMVTVLRIADRCGLLADTPNLAEFVARGQARPAFQRALEDQLATYREHQPEGVAA
ncbi:glutathione S-transferase [Sphingomonas sp. F9_3S_D5_B_2]